MCKSSNEQSAEVIYDGLKLFEKFPQQHLEVVLINHTKILCLEVISKVRGQEVRLYLNMKALITKVDLVVMNATFLKKRQEAIEMNRHFQSNHEMRSIASQMVSKMVVDRLEMTREGNETMTTTPNFDIFLKPTETDGTYDCLDPKSYELHTRVDFQYNEKPVSVLPFNLTKHRIHSIRYGNINDVEILRTASMSPRTPKSVRFSTPVDDSEGSGGTSSESSSVCSSVVDEVDLNGLDCSTPV